MRCVSLPSLPCWCATRTAQSGRAATASWSDIVPAAAAAAALHRARRHRPRMAHVFLKDGMSTVHTRCAGSQPRSAGAGEHAGGRRKAECETSCQRALRGGMVGRPCIYIVRGVTSRPARQEPYPELGFRGHGTMSIWHWGRGATAWQIAGPLTTELLTATDKLVPAEHRISVCPHLLALFGVEQGSG